MQIKYSKSRKHYNWVVTPDSYLAIALLCCEEILRYRTSSKSLVSGSNLFKRLHFTSYHPDYELIHPIIFNFKHGIELYLKSLGNIDHGEYAKSHDPKTIFGFIIRKTYSISNRNLLIKLRTNVWPIIEKYYYGTYIPIRKNKTPDKKNEAERYPEYERAYKIPVLWKWVTWEVIEQIQKDIEYLEKRFKTAQHNIKPGKRWRYERIKYR